MLDPSEFPGTGTPEAGGVTFKELMFAVEEVAKLNIVGFDVNELSLFTIRQDVQQHLPASC